MKNIQLLTFLLFSFKVKNRKRNELFAQEETISSQLDLEHFAQTERLR